MQVSGDGAPAAGCLCSHNGPRPTTVRAARSRAQEPSRTLPGRCSRALGARCAAPGAWRGRLVRPASWLGRTGGQRVVVGWSWVRGVRWSLVVGAWGWVQGVGW